MPTSDDSSVGQESGVAHPPPGTTYRPADRLVVSRQHHTADDDEAAREWFAGLEAELARFRAGTVPGWFDRRMVDPSTVTMTHTSTHRDGYVFCLTEISIPG